MSAARFSFSFSAEHVPGVHDKTAGALLRFLWQEFGQLAPQVDVFLKQVPQQLPDLLISTP